MATAPARPPAASAANASVGNALAAAAGRVRGNDLFTGGAAAAVLALGYLTAVIVLDKLFALPEWARQVGLAAFLGGLAAVAYFLVVRPLRRRVNPRYVARRIETTLPDSKNVLINWVDLQDAPLPGSVKAAVGANAAEGMADADVDTATKSRRVVALGVTAGLLVATLATLALVFSVPQFLSLFQRALVPFAAPAIATETSITVSVPVGGNVTITDGQPLGLIVTLDGRTPDPNGPKRVRLLVRYTQDSDEAVELPMTGGSAAREFRLELGRGTTLNGFWYRVAAGDAVTPEYRVTVRTRPMLSDFRARYEYPAYLKWEASQEENSRLRAIRGTVVTLAVKANRAVGQATLVLAGEKGDRRIVPGVVGGEGKDWLTFTLPLAESGTYRIDFQPAGDGVVSSADYPVEVYADAKPVVEITAPKDEVIQLPLNGLLAVDGAVTDDHGIAGVTLHVRKEGSDTEYRAKPFRHGKPLVRETDGTCLTDLPDYKDSIKLDAVTDAAGKKAVLREKDVLEYWLSATDNCEPDANVGESKRQKVTLLPAVKEPEQQKREEKKQQDRKGEEKKAEGKRDEQLKTEQRPADQNHDPDPAKKPDQPQGQQPDNPEKGVPKEGDTPKTGDPKTGDPKNGDPNKGDKPPEGQESKGGTPDSQPQGDPKGDDQKRQDEEQRKKDDETRRQADELKKKLDGKKEQEKKDAGGARGDNQPDGGTDTPQGEPKPNDGKPNEGKPGGGEKGAAEPKGDPKENPNSKPEDQQGGTGKDEGKQVDGTRSEPKADPKTEPGKANPKGDAKAEQGEGKAAPKDGATPGESKERPKADPKAPPQAQPKPDGSAGDARGADGPQQPQPGGDKKEPPKGDAKPKGEPQRGEEKASPKPEPGATREGSKGDPKSDPAGAKGSGPPKAENKGDGGKPEGGKNGPPPGAAGGKEEKPNEKEAGEGKGEGKKPQPQPGTDPKKGEPGEGKPSPKPDDEADPKGGSGEKTTDPKNPKGGGGEGKPLDPKEAAEALKDLQSKDEGTKKAAQDKLDNAMGKPNREKTEQLQKDLQSADPATRAQAEKELEKMKERAQKGGGAGGQKGERKEPGEKEKKELTDAARDLTSKDAATREAAERKLDNAVGEQARKELQQDLKDVQGADKEKAQAARERIEKTMDQAKKEQGTPGAGGLGDRQKQELADAAKDLTSKDDQKREAAERKLDEAVGKEEREKFRQGMKDAGDGRDPQKAEEARKELEKALNEAKGKGKPNGDHRPGGGGAPRVGDPIQADLENQLKSQELSLDTFKKYRGNKDFLKENNLTDEQYDRFVRDYEKATERLRDQVDARRLNPTAPAGTPGIRNDAGGGRVQGGKEADKLTGSGGGAKPPPGFEEAVRRFNTEASKGEKK